MGANEKQVAGDHYKTGHQPWDFIADHSLGYFEGNIVKYISRHRKKAGVSDVLKALHYCEKLIELYHEDRLHPNQRVQPSQLGLAVYAAANSLSDLDAAIVRVASTWVDQVDLSNLHALLIRSAGMYDPPRPKLTPRVPIDGTEFEDTAL